MLKRLLQKLGGGWGWWALWAVAFLAVSLPFWSFHRSKIGGTINRLRYPWGLTPAEFLPLRSFPNLSGYLLVALLVLLGAAVYYQRFHKPLIAVGAAMCAVFLSIFAAYMILVLNMYLEGYVELRDKWLKPLEPANGDYLLRSGEDGTWRARFTDGENPAFEIALMRMKPRLFGEARLFEGKHPLRGGVRTMRIRRVSDSEVHFSVDWQPGMQDSMVLRLSSPLQSDRVPASIESTTHPGTPIECELVRVRAL